RQIHHLGQCWPARARDQDVAEYARQNKGRSTVSLRNRLLEPIRGGVEITADAVIADKTRRSTEDVARSELSAQWLRALGVSDAREDAGEKSNGEPIPRHQRIGFLSGRKGLGQQSLPRLISADPQVRDPEIWVTLEGPMQLCNPFRVSPSAELIHRQSDSKEQIEWLFGYRVLDLFHSLSHAAERSQKEPRIEVAHPSGNRFSTGRLTKMDGRSLQVVVEDIRHRQDPVRLRQRRVELDRTSC